MEATTGETDLANRSLYCPLWQRVALTQDDAAFAPPKMHPYGGRNLAQAIRALWNASPFLDAREVRRYATGFAELVNNLADANGVISRGGGGQDGEKFLKAPYNLTVPIELTFQEELLRDAVKRLATLPGGELAGRVALAGDTFWLDQDYGYAFETHYQSAPKPMAALRSGISPTVPASAKHYAVPLYRAMVVKGGCLGGFASHEALVAGTEAEGVLSDMQPADVVPRSVLGW